MCVRVNSKGRLRTHTHMQHIFLCVCGCGGFFMLVYAQHSQWFLYPPRMRSRSCAHICICCVCACYAIPIPTTHTHTLTWRMYRESLSVRIYSCAQHTHYIIRARNIRQAFFGVKNCGDLKAFRHIHKSPLSVWRMWWIFLWYTHTHTHVNTDMRCRETGKRTHTESIHKKKHRIRARFRDFYYVEREREIFVWVCAFAATDKDEHI